MNILIAIYSPPEFYPPLLNAIQELSEIGGRITVVTRNIKVTHWAFPENVQVIRIGKELSISATLRASLIAKTQNYILYLWQLRKCILSGKYEVWQANDVIPLFAFYQLLKTGVKKPQLFWYHNHDIADLKGVGKFSIGWWAVKSEARSLEYVDLFSLPSVDRLSYFPKLKNSMKKLIIPNYPSLKKYSMDNVVHKEPEHELKLIYQGSLSEHHGFEELIACLKMMPSYWNVSLTLIGPINDDYKRQLIDLSIKYSVSDKLDIVPPVPYAELQKITAQHHVGLAIHKPVGTIYNTGGTASNKIYEYAAMGLPVILFDNAHYRQYLEKYSWAFFTDCTTESFIREISSIKKNYLKLSLSARMDFERELNFETVFSKATDHLKLVGSNHPDVEL